MANLLSIIRYPDARLRETATAVNRASLRDPNFQALLEDARLTLREHDGRGLTIPQIGTNARALVMQLDNGEIITLINPVLRSIGMTKKLNRESCLSIPGFVGTIRRPARVTVRALNHNGEVVKYLFAGREASIVQHGIDHLNGHLFVDTAHHLLPIEARGAF